MKTNQNKSLFLISGLILIAALTRLIPHYPNFTAVGAIALFGSAYLKSRHMAFLVPLVAMWLSDLILNNILFHSYYDGFTFFTAGSGWIYLAICMVVIFGKFIFQKINIPRFISGALGATVIFFIITNLGHWAGPFRLHPLNFAGLIATYIDAIPFALNTLTGNVFFGSVLFGIYEWIRQRQAIRGIQFEADRY